MDAVDFIYKSGLNAATALQSYGKALENPLKSSSNVHGLSVIAALANSKRNL